MKSDLTKHSFRERMYGIDAPVELGNGKKVPAINLDNAATTPPFKEVVTEIEDKMAYYASIGRGTGQKSKISNEVYVNGRRKVIDFVGADKNYSVFYTNCTTDGMNKLASALIKSSEDIVLTTRMEHHANDLPWRERGRTVYAEVDEVNGRLIPEEFDHILRMYGGKIKYVAVTAASNVTGYVNDVHKIAAIAHKHGAKIIVDGAQIVAHRKFSMVSSNDAENIDFFVFSAHKMYSPFGGGAVVGLTKLLNEHIPAFYGGGMIDTVTDYGVFYSEVPDLYEAGSPNYPGVVGMVKAMDILREIGFGIIEEHEKILLKRAVDKLSAIKGVTLYGDNDNMDDRVGIVTFTIKDLENELVSQELADISAISVRQAAFCAHSYVRRLTKEGITYDENGRPRHPKGMIRVSFGIYNSEKDVDCLAETVETIVNKVRAQEKGSRASLFREQHSGEYAYLYKTPHDRG